MLSQAIYMKTESSIQKAEKRSQGSEETLKGLGSDYRPNSLQPKQLHPDYVSSYKKTRA